MGRGEFAGREQKKQKKDNKKTLTSIQPLRPVVEVEVVGKKKKKGSE
jgi:hypothetical protein